MPLLVGPTDQAEVGLEQEMALESEKRLRPLPLATANDLGDGDLGIVVTDPLGHAAEKVECATMSFHEGLCAFPREDAAEDGVAVHERHHEQGHLDALSVPDDLGGSEVHLGFARPMDERHVDLPAPLLPVAHRFFDRRVSPEVAVFVPKPLEETAFCMALLAVDVSVLTQNLVNDRQIGPDLPLPTGLALPVAGWLGMLQDLLERVPVNLELPAHASFATLLDFDQTANLCPLLHVCEHPCLPRATGHTGTKSRSYTT